MTSFADFIRSDNFYSYQRVKMTKLALTTEKLQTFQIQTKPDTNPKGKGFALSLNQNEADISYKLEKLRLQIIDGEVSNVHYKRLGTKIRESKRLTWIIILAMLDKKHSNIVKMLAEKDMNIDAPIFKLKHMPTLYYLACMLKCDRLMKYGDHKKYWLGIPASVLSGNIGIGDVQSVMSVTQFKYFNELIKVYQMIRKKEVNPFFEIYEQHKKTLQSTHEVPVLYSDLYCAYNDHDAISRFLPRYYNMIKNSKMVYLLQCNTNIVLHLQSYSITPYNFYCNLSPLHVAAYYGNLEVLAMYVELAFNPNKQDFNGNTPMHFAAMMGHKLCYDFMCHKIYLDTCRFSFNKGDEYKTNKKGQQPKELLKSNTKSKGNYDLIRTINNLKKARTAAESFKETKFRLISFDTIFNGENNSALKKHIQKLQTILVDDHDFDMSSKHCYEMFCKIVMDK